MKIYNAFSQTPTRNHRAAGIDFFIPNIKDDAERAPLALEAFKQSYNLTDKKIEHFIEKVVEKFGDINDTLNILHLYYSLKSERLYNIRIKDNEDVAIEYFLNNILTFDKNGNPGMILVKDEMVKFNSGIKVGLKPHTCLEFKNKSGKGSQGWQVLACLVDEDYAGFIHLNLKFGGFEKEDGTIYCGDKFVQGVVYRTETDDAEEESLDVYNEYMKNSQRGDNGFGSSDVKH